MSGFPRTLSILLFIVALIVRLFALTLRNEYRPPPEPVVIGAEAGEIAHHFLAGHGFATPFDVSRGASSSTYLPPLYPLFLAGLGGLGLSRTWIFSAAVILNLLVSAAMPVVALHVGVAARFPKPVSLLAALILCFCPEAFRAVGLVWDEALFATLVAWTLWWMLRRLMPKSLPENRSALIAPASKTSFFLGCINGALALLNPAMVIALPFAWLAALRARGTSWSRLTLHAALLASATFLASSPWHIRNWFLLSPPARVFIRGNFWLEVWSSMHPILRLETGDGVIKRIVHPWHGSESLIRQDLSPPIQLTEQQYFDWCRERSLNYLRKDKRQLLAHVTRQFNAFWLGIAEAQRWFLNPWTFFVAQGIPAIAGILGLYLARKRIAPHVMALFCTLLIVFPIPYYLTGGAARYRHPIDLPLYFGAAWLPWILLRLKELKGSILFP